MVMSPHVLISSATPFGLENVKLLRRNKAANAFFCGRSVIWTNQPLPPALILIQRFGLPCAMERRRLRRVVRLAMKSAIEGGVSLAMRHLVGSAWPKKRSQ